MGRTVALGFFDGVHIGHGELLREAKRISAADGSVPCVVSFDIHPDTVVTGTAVPLITGCDDRKDIIRRFYGIDEVVFIHFNRSVMNMPWDEFLSDILNELDIIGIVCGYDFSFGSRGEGNPEKLAAWCAERNIKCSVMPEVRIDGITVSSTYIRELLSDGKMEEADRFLGHPYCISGIVRTGRRIGRTIGAPTVNLAFEEGILIPRKGVYATAVALPSGEEKAAVTNIGVRPTFDDGDGVTLESHILDYSGNLYGERIRVDFLSFIRPEKKFDCVEDLSRQIEEDAEKVRLCFDCAATGRDNHVG